MDIKIKRIDESLPLPEYKTKGSVGFDIYTRIDAEIKPGEIAKLPSNLILETPEGYMLMIAARSSLPTKFGLALANSVGILDNDFCGDDDEFIIQVINFTNKVVKVQKGDRLAQGIFVKVDKANWREVDRMEETSRGGIGSTGRN